MKPSAPPYVFPRQKPTAGSCDVDGTILVRHNLPDCMGRIYGWSVPRKLQDGDVWIPGCALFWSEWAPGVDFVALHQRRHADKYWPRAKGET